MKGLKIAAIVSVSLLMVMALLVGYLFLTAEVQITGISVTHIPVETDAEQFEKLKTSIAENTFQGTLYQVPVEWKSASEYVYLDYTVHIRNNCLVPIDMIEVQVVPQSTDILQFANLTVHSLDLKSDGKMNVRILAPENAHSVREMIITYYVWGVSFTMKTTYGG